MKHMKIACAGDSITDCGCVKPPVFKPYTMIHELGYGYVAFLFGTMNVLHPGDPIHVLNHGVSGDRTIQLFDRFDQVLAEKPDILTIMIGVNDVWVEFNMPDRKDVHIHPQEYEVLMRVMVEKALTVVRRVVLISPFHLQPSSHPFRIELKKRQDVLQKITKEHRVRYLDIQSKFDMLTEKTGIPFLSHDSIHVNAIGQMLIANELLQALNDEDREK